MLSFYLLIILCFSGMDFISNSNVRPRRCTYCGEIVVGRIDKKFCSDQCRNTYNNRLNGYVNNSVRNINSILRKNRKILEELQIDSGITTVARDVLLSKGFNFNYHTHIYTTRKDDTYRFCYEYGYLFLKEKDRYLLVANKDKSTNS